MTTKKKNDDDDDDDEDDEDDVDEDARDKKKKKILKEILLFITFHGSGTCSKCVCVTKVPERTTVGICKESKTTDQ